MSKNKKIAFTDREKQIIELLAKGYKYTDISKKLFLGYSTVTSIVSNIVKKTESNNMVNAIFNIYYYKLMD